MRSLRAAVIAAGLSLAVPTALAAQWLTLPNGELGFALSYSTAGLFSCLSQPMDVVQCTASGNAVTLTQGGATMTMTFTGTAANVTATNVSHLISLGSITTTFGGVGHFPMPITGHPLAPFLHLGVAVETSLGARAVCRPMSPRPSGLVAYGTEYGCSGHFALGLPRPPAPASYGSVVFSEIPFHQITYTPAVYDFSARVSIIPEPATVALLGAGLLALGGVGAVRRLKV